MIEQLHSSGIVSRHFDNENIYKLSSYITNLYGYDTFFPLTTGNEAYEVAIRINDIYSEKNGKKIVKH